MRSSVTWLISGAATAACLSRPVSAFGAGGVVLCSLILNSPKTGRFLQAADRVRVAPYYGVLGSSFAKCLQSGATACRGNSLQSKPHAMTRRAKHQPAPSEFIRCDRGVTATDARARIAERDARMAADTRTECQKVLGDPPRDRSATASRRRRMRQAGRRELRHVGDVAIVKAPFERQHCREALQKLVALFLRHVAGDGP